MHVITGNGSVIIIFLLFATPVISPFKKFGTKGLMDHFQRLNQIQWDGNKMKRWYRW